MKGKDQDSRPPYTILLKSDVFHPEILFTLLRWSIVLSLPLQKGFPENTVECFTQPGANVINIFYGCNLGMFLTKLVFVPGKPFQPILMFVSFT